MELLTKQLRARFAAVGMQEGAMGNALVIAKFFTPRSNWTWFATEFDGDDTFFGFVCGHEGEWGSFLLSELGSNAVWGGPLVERDLHWTEQPLREALDEAVAIGAVRPEVIRNAAL
jgi:hypothetical protein